MDNNKKHKIKPDDDYLGIPRKEIPWYPTIDQDKCDGCGICVDFCSLETYSYDNTTAMVSNPYNCVVGCNGCEDKCPNKAITFPSTKVIDKIRKKYKV